MLVGHERSEATKPIDNPFGTGVEKMRSVAVNSHASGRDLVICVSAYMGTPVYDLNAHPALGKGPCINGTCEPGANYQYGPHVKRSMLGAMDRSAKINHPDSQKVGIRLIAHLPVL